jgi:orotate phosphoribosyltransferase
MAMASRLPVPSSAPTLDPLPEVAVARARLRDIIHVRSFGYGEVKLASGRVSNFYFNLKPTMLDAEGAALLGALTLDALAGERIDYIGGLEMGAVPIAGAVAQLSFMTGAPVQAFFVRKKPKEHGAKLSIEGLMPGESLRGKRVVVVEDVTTTGGSAVKAIEPVRDAGAEIAFVLSIVDREEGATENFAAMGLDFRVLYRASEFLNR